jgi:hypothetical protein
MRFLSRTLCGTVAIALLSACAASAPTTSPAALTSAGTQSSPESLVPLSQRPSGPMALHGRPVFKAVPGGLYVSQFYSTSVAAYTRLNSSNNPPVCTIPGAIFPNDIASDDRGDVIVPNGGGHSIMIFKGSGKCGNEIGHIYDKYGQPTDVSTADALTKVVAVANMHSARGYGHHGGTITLCTVSGGCTTNLINPNMATVVGVAMSKSGDCWASAENSSGTPTLTYFQGCTGAGQTATGFENSAIGGLDIDNHGNIIALSSTDAQAYVYSGCNPDCTLVSGPFTLEGQAIYGHFNKQAMTFATADYQYGQVDVYRYEDSQLTYMYSFNNGLSASNVVEGVAYAPRSHE